MSRTLSATGLRSLSDAHFDQLNPPRRRFMWHRFSRGAEAEQIACRCKERDTGALYEDNERHCTLTLSLIDIPVRNFGHERSKILTQNSKATQTAANSCSPEPVGSNGVMVRDLLSRYRLVLEERMESHRPVPETLGLLAQMESGFSSELILMRR